ncbi:MAG: heavy metal-binding domain-containing protein [Solirubrobacteraceae bacterium]
MVLSTMNDPPGYEIEEVFGEVFGLAVSSRNLGSQIGTAVSARKV